MKTDNLALLQKAAGNQVVPLTNLGRDNREIAAALRELANSYTRAGRNREAQQLMEKLASYDSATTAATGAHPFGG